MAPHQSVPAILLASRRVQQCTAEVISKLLLSTLEKLELSTNQLLMFLSDGAAHMLSVGRSLKIHCTNLLHFTCKIHTFSLVAGRIRKCDPEVDALIARTKAVFVKSPKRIREFHRLYPGMPEPPDPILTRWGTWLQAAIYYDKYFENIKNVVLKLDPKEAAAIKKSQSNFQDSQVKTGLKTIQNNYFGLVEAIEKLQNPSVSLVEFLQIVQHVHAQLCAVEDAKDVRVLEKLESVLEKKSDSGTLKPICDGPGYWGLMNPQWNMCSRGRRQSPINVEPDKLLFDPYLRVIHLDKHKVSGTLHNTGQSLVFRVDKDTKQHVNISGGPLAYRYQFEEIYIHYGIEDQQGSEHHIHGYSFPGEIQLYGFNKELYHNMTEAQHKSQGIVGISLMVQIGDTPNPELRIITSTFNKVRFKGAATPIKHLSLRTLLPDTEHFMTYEGSTTHPGCWETTVWIILNKPIYITKHELYVLRKLMQGSEEAPKAPLGNNVRPVQELHHRTIRTNINFQNSKNGNCPSMYKEMYYKANKWTPDVKDQSYHAIHHSQH